jgi:hypothetical protein
MDYRIVERLSWLEAVLLATLGETRRGPGVLGAARRMKFLKMQICIYLSLPLKN